MANTLSDIGLVGLAVMGQNLALNIADHGYKISVFNRTTSKMTDFDLFTAVSGCLLAEQNPYFSFRKAAKSFRVNTTGWIAESDY